MNLTEVNEYLLEKEEGELSYAELAELQKGTTFSRAQVQRLHRRYCTIAQGKTQVTKADVVAALPYTLREDYVLERMLAVHSDADGVVSMAQFVRLMAPFEQSCPYADQLTMLFSLYDLDGDGRVSQKDLQVFLTRISDNTITSGNVYQALNATFAALDTDRDGYLRPADFQRAAGDSLDTLMLPLASMPY